MKGIQPGTVLLTVCNFARPYPKDKFFVTLCLEPQSLFFMINSKVHVILQHAPFIERQVCIEVKDHAFLSYDSYIDCTQPSVLQLEEIEASKICGCISDDVKARIVNAVENSPLIAPVKQRFILEALK